MRPRLALALCLALGLAYAADVFGDTALVGLAFTDGASGDAIYAPPAALAVGARLFFVSFPRPVAEGAPPCTLYVGATASLDAALLEPEGGGTVDLRVACFGDVFTGGGAELVSAFGLALDASERLWVLDQGRPDAGDTAKVVVVDTAGVAAGASVALEGRLVVSCAFPDLAANSFLTNLVVDSPRGVAYAVDPNTRDCVTAAAGGACGGGRSGRLYSYLLYDRPFLAVDFAADPPAADGFRPHALALSLDGNQLYFAAFGGASVFREDTVGLRSQVYDYSAAALEEYGLSGARAAAILLDSTDFLFGASPDTSELFLMNSAGNTMSFGALALDAVDAAAALSPTCMLNHDSRLLTLWSALGTVAATARGAGVYAALSLSYVGRSESERDVPPNSFIASDILLSTSLSTFGLVLLAALVPLALACLRPALARCNA